VASAVFAALVLSVGPSWAIVCAAPAPLIGVTGPYGLLAAGAVYGGYLLFKRFRHRG
jgi:hypothetical protein